ncbi:Putative cryptochrome DASH [Cladobotryum mycophilum]|uniref:Cryptochrome DASH n=1 Tax=Cladobotryum mycophilum TaxID=491253 RepID=A0ABR0T4M7_9HYPO
MSGDKLLIYVLRRDLRVADNPIFHHLATTTNHGFTHLLPVYVFPSHQVETSGFLKDGETSPYPPALSSVGKFWRCGPHRAKFTAECVWDMKVNLEALNSGLIMRVGSATDVVKHIIQHFQDKGPPVGAVWMTEEPSHEEIQEQDAVSKLCADSKVDFKLWLDEKYFIDDRDTSLNEPIDLPDVFTTYRKSQEPLRERPRQAVPAPKQSSLPPLPEHAVIPEQHHPFVAAKSIDDLIGRLQKPLDKILANPPAYPDGAVTAHPFLGGENPALDRVKHLIKTGGMTAYKDTRNGLLGLDFSTKLSGYLALGCITARQIHEELLKFEDGTETAYAGADEYGKGENEGTKGVRFELLWRDYMRLCTRKFGSKLFRAEGFRQDDEGYNKTWKTANKAMAQSNQDPPAEEIAKILERFLEGTTGMGLIDASQRELYHTGYTSNRARQNVASFFAKHLCIDWRYGAEWYEMMLVDYDVSSNWANWQYVAGVGNDPRGDARIFNPVKQGFDYDKDGTYVRTWVPEIKSLSKLENLFQAWTASPNDLAKAGLTNNIMVTDPLKRIEFTVDHRPNKPHRAGFSRWRGPSRGGGYRGGGDSGNRNDQTRGFAGDVPNGGSFGGSFGGGGPLAALRVIIMATAHLPHTWVECREVITKTTMPCTVARIAPDDPMEKITICEEAEETAVVGAFMVRSVQVQDEDLVGDTNQGDGEEELVAHLGTGSSTISLDTLYPCTLPTTTLMETQEHLVTKLHQQCGICIVRSLRLMGRNGLGT